MLAGLEHNHLFKPIKIRFHFYKSKLCARIPSSPKCSLAPSKEASSNTPTSPKTILPPPTYDLQPPRRLIIKTLIYYIIL